MNATDDQQLKPALREALALVRAGQLGPAETTLTRLHEARPDSPEAALSLARLLLQRGERGRAEATLALTLRHQPAHEMLAVELAALRAGVGDLREAAVGLQAFVDQAPASPLAWLMLARLLDDTGHGGRALMAKFEALSQAQRMGVWMTPETTPPHLAASVGAAVAAMAAGRREIFNGVLEPLRRTHGEEALKRIDRAVSGYLKDWDATPADPMQRPRFLYIPDLPISPYMDPMLHAWAPRLQAAFADIRAEALSVIAEQWQLQDFVEVRDGDRIDNYLGGAKPAWEAYFFYRHGERFDDNHRRCPRTSAVLESLDLSRIPGQTPEICFSVLAPGTHILPHHGVTNMRAVMHLPLVVPRDCALHLVDRGVHHWVEGELVMFDDTFLHESWNRSDSVRVIVLMDCWNPHLSTVEREAASLLARAIGSADVSPQAAAWGHRRER